MAFCSNCRFEVLEGESFCEQCGTRIRTRGRQSTRRTVSAGVIYSCPVCGAAADSFTPKCLSCGHEFRDVKPSGSISQLFEKLERARSDSEKIHLIKTFPIPNSKEDIYEFMFMAVSNYSERSYAKDENGIAAAWYAKIELCYQKASVAFEDSKEFAKIEELYQGVKHKTEQAVSVRDLIIALPALLIALGAILFFINVKPISTAGSFMLIAGIILAAVRSSAKREQQFIEHPELKVRYTQQKAQRGYSSWSVGAKIGWVLLNIYLLGIPALFYSKRKR